MRRSRRFLAGGLAAAGLVAVLGIAGIAQAQQPATFEMSITENRIQGASGQTTITPLGNDQARVDIRITGLQPNNQHAAHIHTAQGARCDTNAPVTYPLTNVSVDGSGVGTSTTTITLTADKPIQANNAYVNVHQMAMGGPGVICANITQSYTAGGAGGAGAAGGTGGTGGAGAQTPSALPQTGTGGFAEQTSAGWLLAGLAALFALFGGTGALAVARRRK
jgi:hypothetical protein